ncbi:hypothetical protein BDV25DRAFT_135204 [Aspergillus avenaceus]|uniref:Uncharacterized protein n=1 Tax=Aspergillus avenaceus TaxID=36643 RepID=A0A5N6U9A0_ASPAV|nr:hypothetical protein BDV25DRAFT_135204 [Aspergillus avenaceus]
MCVLTRTHPQQLTPSCPAPCGIGGTLTPLFWASCESCYLDLTTSYHSPTLKCPAARASAKERTVIPIAPDSDHIYHKGEAHEIRAQSLTTIKFRGANSTPRVSIDDTYLMLFKDIWPIVLPALDSQLHDYWKFLTTKYEDTIDGCDMIRSEDLTVNLRIQQTLLEGFMSLSPICCDHVVSDGIRQQPITVAACSEQNNSRIFCASHSILPPVIGLPVAGRYLLSYVGVVRSSFFVIAVRIEAPQVSAQVPHGFCPHLTSDRSAMTCSCLAKPYKGFCTKET